MRWSSREDLPQGVLTLQAGLVVNAFGNGAVAPFLLLYLHDARGIPLALAGLASATSAVCALAATLVGGGLGDRLGARRTMIGGLACSTLAYCLYPLVRAPWHAFALAVLAGAGIGTWLTMQSTLLAAITPAEVRHLAFARQRVAANIGLGLGGFAGGFIVITSRPATFTVLFLVNAATFVVYTLFLLRVVVPEVPRKTMAGGYRQVVADRVFLRLGMANLVIVAAAVSLLNGLFPVYAKNHAHISERVIGGLFLLNSLTIIALQLRTARFIEGMRRMPVFAAMGGLFAAAWLLVAAAGTLPTTVAVAVGVLVAFVLVFSLAECVYDSIVGPLVADLAPPELLGRYVAVNGFAWQLGFIIGPAAGAAILAAAPTALWLIAAVACAAAGAYAMRFERRLPESVRRTPRRAAVAAKLT
jgi:MFS family permease